MRFVSKMPKFSVEKEREYLEDGWVKLREPKHIVVSMLLSFPFIFVLGLVSLALMGLFQPLSWELLGIGKTTRGFAFEINFLLILLVAVVIIAHELIHLCLVPRFMTSPTTVFGLTWFGGFAYTEEVIAKNRFILVALMPFLLISVLLPVVLGGMGMLGTAFRLGILLNAAASSVDFFNSLLVWWQVPRGGVLVMNGPVTYYK